MSRPMAPENSESVLYFFILRAAGLRFIVGTSQPKRKVGLVPAPVAFKEIDDRATTEPSLGDASLPGERLQLSIFVGRQIDRDAVF